MAYFNKDNRGGGGDKFGKRNFGPRNDRPQMHDAVCGKCGKRCQVPFRPTGERPVLCSDCFGKDRDGSPERGGGRNFDRRDSGNPRFEERRMYSATCSNCGKKCEVPFLPTGGRPTYCNDCFGGAAGGDLTLDVPARDERPKRSFDDRKFTDRTSSKPADSYKADFAALNTKLDKLISILTPSTSQKEVAKPVSKPVSEPVAEIADVKEAKKSPVKKVAAPKKAKAKTK